ncbi:MAG: hypothetical protein IJJ11_04630 [Methanosphaera sp.]|uniref:hypothetical protein n=1 Tax=Methanosphaera sp. BMS TaxID=1789762 RepID=UPI000DC1D70A|nr:hypothetical protein [Methanosphaera sp. BMS]AWX32776.1 hypothetical protein AW729_06555 [Methanosphaera sp. BMS]MBQ6443951.1 hypothetical protein [Methanosphaera sp.]MBR3213482.1 hypothetical protein [Methanosphaera sp.]
MDKILDFNELFFGDLEEYKKLIIGLLESLKVVSATTLWSITEDTPKGLSTIVTMDIMEIILDSMERISENLYTNKLIAHEFPIFVETKEMIEILLTDPIFDSDEYLNFAITLFSDFFTLLEVKLLLFDGCNLEIEAPQHVLDEYDKELDKYFIKFDEHKDYFIKLHE